MSEPTLEARVTALEQLVARLLQERTGPLAQPPGPKWWEPVAGIMKDDPGFADVIEYGRYFRKTGKMPPDDWNPGDPIPEPEE